MDIGAGFAVHSGWAAAVLATGDGRRPVVLDRRRVTLCPEALPRQVYHAAQDLPPAKAALLDLVIETRDREHREETVDKLRAAGFEVEVRSNPGGTY